MNDIEKIEIVLSDINVKDIILVDVKELRINHNGKIKSLIEEQLKDLLNIIIYTKNKEKETKIIDYMKCNIKIYEKERITDIQMNNNLINLKKWLDDIK